MHRALIAVLFGTSVLVGMPGVSEAAPAPAASGAADLCQELLAYADKKAAEAPKGSADQAPSPTAAPLPRGDAGHTGTQGGGSVGPSASADTGSQGAAPTTVPAAPGAASEPATSPHATDSSDADKSGSARSEPEIKLGGGITLQEVRDTAGRSDRQACRETTQKLRLAGADLPAALIALAAYEPDPAKR